MKNWAKQCKTRGYLQISLKKYQKRSTSKIGEKIVSYDERDLAAGIQVIWGNLYKHLQAFNSYLSFMDHYIKAWMTSFSSFQLIISEGKLWITFEMWQNNMAI